MQSVIYAFAALGIMIPFRLLSFPDLTVEGSFPLGGCVAAALIAAQRRSLAATVAAVLAGVMAGLATATIHLTLRLNTLLCGILVLTMLFSINIRIMGKPNTALFAYSTFFDNLLGASSPRSTAHGLALSPFCSRASRVHCCGSSAPRSAWRCAQSARAHSMARAQGLSVDATPYWAWVGRLAVRPVRRAVGAEPGFRRRHHGLRHSGQRIGLGYHRRTTGRPSDIAAGRSSRRLSGRWCSIRSQSCARTSVCSRPISSF